MPKQPSGAYKIRFYDRYGTPIKSRDTYASNLQEAKTVGNKQVEDDESYTIDLRVFNSLDDRRRW